jgi:hypothetical protein
MVTGDRILYCPFAFGYSNYARPEFAKHKLTFGGLVTGSGRQELRYTLRAPVSQFRDDASRSTWQLLKSGILSVCCRASADCISRAEASLRIALLGRTSA